MLHQIAVRDDTEEHTGPKRALLFGYTRISLRTEHLQVVGIECRFRLETNSDVSLAIPRVKDRSACKLHGELQEALFPTCT